MNDTQMREEFESRLIPNLALKRDKNGNYVYPAARIAWRDFCDGYRAGQASVPGTSKWMPIDDVAKSGKPIFGFHLRIADAVEQKGIKEGWLALPNVLPFICRYVPECEHYNEAWETLDAYGKVLDDDGVKPTHWMPLPAQPNQIIKA